MAENYDKEYAKKAFKGIERRRGHKILFKKFEVIGKENLDKSSTDRQRLYISNHQSHSDYLLAWLQFHRQKAQMPMIAAGKNLDIKLFQWIRIDFGKLGAFWIDRNRIKEKDRNATRQVNSKVCQLIENGHDILIFPEGGRSYDGKLFTDYKVGAINKVLRTKKDLDIVNIAFDYNPRIEHGYFKLLKATKKLKGKVGTGLYLGLDLAAFASRYLSMTRGDAYMNIGKPQPLETITKTARNLSEEILAVKNHSKKEIEQLYAEISKT